MVPFDIIKVDLGRQVKVSVRNRHFAVADVSPCFVAATYMLQRDVATL